MTWIRRKVNDFLPQLVQEPPQTLLGLHEPQEAGAALFGLHEALE